MPGFVPLIEMREREINYLLVIIVNKINVGLCGTNFLGKKSQAFGKKEDKCHMQ